jgi:hypothetical protein
MHKQYLLMKTFIRASHVIVTMTYFLFSCDDSNKHSTLPECVEKQLFTQDMTRKPPIEVWKWEVDGNTYYYFVSDCCDQYNYLFTSNCEMVCAPDGGFSGKGDGKCPEFEGQIEKTLMWKNENR